MQLYEEIEKLIEGTSSRRGAGVGKKFTNEELVNIGQDQGWTYKGKGRDGKILFSRPKQDGTGEEWGYYADNGKIRPYGNKMPSKVVQPYNPQNAAQEIPTKDTTEAQNEEKVDAPENKPVINSKDKSLKDRTTELTQQQIAEADSAIKNYITSYVNRGGKQGNVDKYKNVDIDAVYKNALNRYLTKELTLKDAINRANIDINNNANAQNKILANKAAQNTEVRGTDGENTGSSNCVNPANEIFLTPLDTNGDIYNSIINAGKIVQSIFFDAETNQIKISYNDKANESRDPKSIPDFLSKYMEEQDIKFLSRYLEDNGNGETTTNDQPVKNINGIFTKDVQNYLKENKLDISKMEREGNNIICYTASGEKVNLSDIMGKMEASKGSPYDFDLSDQDVIDIEKEILRSLNLEKTAEYISKNINFKDLPFNLKITLGGVLKESKIVNYRYRITEDNVISGIVNKAANAVANTSVGKAVIDKAEKIANSPVGKVVRATKQAVNQDYHASVNTNAKPKKFLVQFEATQIINQEKPEEKTSQESQEKSKEKQDNEQVSNFNEVSNEDVIKLISSIKKLLLNEIKNVRRTHGGLTFKKEKKISQQRNGVGKVLMGEDTKDKTFAVSMVLSGGEENADYNFKKDENKITGSFSLSISLGNAKRDMSGEIGAVISQVSNAIGTTDNSGATL